MIETLDADLSVISALPERPSESGITASELKAEFDKAGNIIKEYINETLIPSINSAEIPAEETEGVEGETVAEQISDLARRIAELA